MDRYRCYTQLKIPLSQHSVNFISHDLTDWLVKGLCMRICITSSLQYIYVCVTQHTERMLRAAIESFKMIPGTSR